jgi:hypothetical protein
MIRGRYAAAAMVHDGILGLLAALHKALEVFLRSPPHSSAGAGAAQGEAARSGWRRRLRLLALQVWVLDKGVAVTNLVETRFFSSHSLLAPVQGFVGRRVAHLHAARRNKILRVFNARCQRKACARVAAALGEVCARGARAADGVGAHRPSSGWMGDDSHASLPLHEAFRGAAPGGDARGGGGGADRAGAVAEGTLETLRDECIDVMRRYAADSMQRWAKRDVADKDAVALARILEIPSRLGLPDDVDHMLFSIPRLGGQCASAACLDAPPLVTGWQVLPCFRPSEISSRRLSL